MALMKSPTRKLLLLMVNFSAEKSGCLNSAAISGVSRSLVRAGLASQAHSAIAAANASRASKNSSTRTRISGAAFES